MMTNNSRMWTLLAVLVLSIALGASPAIAQPVIEEVQVVDRGMHFTPGYPISCGRLIRLPRTCWTISE